jgi:hypothetical protein
VWEKKGQNPIQKVLMLSQSLDLLLRHLLFAGNASLLRTLRTRTRGITTAGRIVMSIVVMRAGTEGAPCLSTFVIQHACQKHRQQNGRRERIAHGTQAATELLT